MSFNSSQPSTNNNNNSFNNSNLEPLIEEINKNPNPLRSKEPKLLKKRRADAPPVGFINLDDSPEPATSATVKTWSKIPFLTKIVTEEKRTLLSLLSRNNAILLQIFKLENERVPNSLRPGTRLQLGANLPDDARNAASEQEKQIKDSYTVQMVSIVLKSKNAERLELQQKIADAPNELAKKLATYCNVTAWGAEILKKHLASILEDFQEFFHSSELSFTHRLTEGKNNIRKKLTKEVEMQDALDMTPTKEVIKKLVTAEVKKQMNLKGSSRAPPAQKKSTAPKNVNQRHQLAPPNPKSVGPTTAGGRPRNASNRTSVQPANGPPPPQKQQQRLRRAPLPRQTPTRRSPTPPTTTAPTAPRQPTTRGGQQGRRRNRGGASVSRPHPK